MATLAIVTVTYNSESVIDGFLDSAAGQSFADFTLYVVDNASTDGTLERVRRRRDHRLVVIANPDNRGVAAGNNQGIRASLAAGCQVVALINNDTEFGPELFAELFAALDRSGSDMVTPKILYAEPRNRIWCAGGEFRPSLGYAVRHVGADELDAGQYDRPRRIRYAPTCCLFVRAAVFARVGLMEEKFFVYADDADFCLRALRAGVTLGYWPRAILWHKVSALTGGGYSPFSVRYLTRNRIFFLRRNVSKWALPLLLAAHQGLFLARAIIGRESWAIYRLRQKAFWEGLCL